MITIYLRAKLVRYAIVGVVSTGIYIIAAFFIIYFVDDSIFSSNISGFACAFLFSYLAQSKFVFNSNISLIECLFQGGDNSGYIAFNYFYYSSTVDICGA